jgi:DNA transformation protein
MSGNADFVAYLLELLQPLCRCSARRMFGGYGVYGDGLMFALVFDGRLYLKVDDLNKPEFVAAGCEPFVYEGQEKPIEVSYWTVPEAALESSEDMAPWARRALAAALRKANAQPVAKQKPAAKKPQTKKSAKKSAEKKAPAKKALPKKSTIRKNAGRSRQGP